MRQEHRAEATPGIHPAVIAARTGPRRPPAPLVWQVTAAPRGTAAEDVSRHRDTPVGDLAFLARFAFGRY